MLIPGMIPTEEPMIRVGIILPEDEQKKIAISCSSRTTIRIDNENSFSPDDFTINLFIANDSLFCTYSGIEKPVNSLRITVENKKSFLTIDSVVAGRGFHWKKNINVKLSHTIDVFLIGNKLVLVNELPLENYLACVATSEMSASCPTTFIEAQTIVARSWMLANVEQKHISLGFDVCNDDCCQRFQGVNNLSIASLRAAKTSRGKVLLFNQKICDARYSKSCGGIMEKFENLWEGDGLAYMQNIQDSEEAIYMDLTKEENLKYWVSSSPKAFCSPHYIKDSELPKYLGDVDEQASYFRWEIIIDQKELCKNINDKLILKAQEIVSLIPLQRAGSGRILKLKIIYTDQDGQEKTVIIHKDYEVRKVLHPSFLYSSACSIEAIYKGQKQPVSFRYRGAGWGHGAGLCQIGALGMSLHGYGTKEILQHYYPDTELKSIY